MKDIRFPFPDASGFMDHRKLESLTGFTANYNLTDMIEIFYRDMLAKGQTAPKSYPREDRALSLLKPA